MSRRDNPALPLRSYAFFEASDGPRRRVWSRGAHEGNRLLFGRCPREEPSAICKGNRQQILCAAVDGLVRFAPINNASLNIEMALLSNSNFSMERYERKCPHRWDSGGVFWERQTVLWSLPVLLLLSSCGSAGPECDSLDTRNSVDKIVSDDSNIMHLSTTLPRIRAWLRQR